MRPLGRQLVNNGSLFDTCLWWPLKQRLRYDLEDVQIAEDLWMDINRVLWDDSTLGASLGSTIGALRAELDCVPSTPDIR